MSTKTTIYLVRHGESVANRDKIISGHFDTPLSEEGKKQAAKTRDELAHIQFDQAYSSDLIRTVETAEIIYGKSPHDSRRLIKLRERTFGELEGKPNKHLVDLVEKYRVEYEAMSPEERWQFSYAADMESNHVVAERFLAAVEEIAQENPGKTILIATHGGCIRLTLIKLGYGNDLELMRSGVFANAGYVELIVDKGKFVIGKVVGVKKEQTL